MPRVPVPQLDLRRRRLVHGDSLVPRHADPAGCTLETADVVELYGLGDTDDGQLLLADGDGTVSVRRDHLSVRWRRGLRALVQSTPGVADSSG